MQDLQLIGVQEDGEHLLLSGPDDERFQMPVDDALRAAIRRDRPRLGQQQIELDGGLRPRDVQALIRAGASTDEAASRAGWSVEKIHRYEGPILAEREHVAGLAQGARLRSRTGVSSGGSAPTLSARVTERLKERDVEVTDTSWDSWRTEGRPWTVVLTFAAGGRQRQASWTYDLADRTVSAVDDEARWLSEEVQEAKGPIPAPRQRPAPSRHTTVYDVEAEGGLRTAAGEERERDDHDREDHRAEHHEDPLDLMTAMRKRSTARGRRRPGGHGVAGEDHPQQPAEPPASPVHQAEHDSETTTSVTETVISPEPSQVAQHSASHDGSSHDNSRHDNSAGQGSAGEGSATNGSPSDAGAREHEPPEQSTRLGQARVRPKRPARETARKTGRPSVPTWDEIMFGSKSGGDRSS